MMTPGQASRIACWISLLTATSQDGRCPLFGACCRRWMCMTDAPASNAAFASRAICSGVTGTLCCFGSVSTPFSAQVMTALSLMPLMSRTLIIQRWRSCDARHVASCAEKLETMLRRVGLAEGVTHLFGFRGDRIGGLRLRLIHPTRASLARLRQPHRLAAAIDREIPRADEDRARLQSVEAADRVAEMGAI